MTGRARPSLFARLLLALISLTLVWAPLSHAGPCGHEGEAGVAAVSDAFASEEAAAPARRGTCRKACTSAAVRAVISMCWGRAASAPAWRRRLRGQSLT